MPSSESAAWVSELPYRLAVALLRAGFTNQQQLRDAIRAGRLNQYTHADIGKRSWEVICAWLGLDPKAQYGPTANDIKTAIELLERAGYMVIGPK